MKIKISKKLFFLPVILLILTSCRTPPVLPPDRPVAFMIPTVFPGAYLKECHPLDTDRELVVQCLKKFGALEDLRIAWFQTDDYDVIVRGLKKRGYAEIDARRSNLPWKWMTLTSKAEDTITVTAGFTEKPLPPYAPEQLPTLYHTLKKHSGKGYITTIVSYDLLLEENKIVKKMIDTTPDTPIRWEVQMDFISFETMPEGE